MNRAMLTAAATMGQLHKKLDTIGNNIANVNTTGFKQRDARFGELLAQELNNQPEVAQEVGRQTPNGIRLGVGAKVADASMRLTQGAIKTTDRMLDVAITKENLFFQVNATENGEEVTRLTRDGAFYITPNPDDFNALDLVAKDGSYVRGVDGKITIPRGFKDIIISETGEVNILNAADEQINVGQLELVNVTRPQLLVSAGENQFAVPNLDELGYNEEDIYQVVQPRDAALQQRALEESNVDLSKQMTELMLTQRAYQFNSQSISISDQMAGLINGLRT